MVNLAQDGLVCPLHKEVKAKLLDYQLFTSYRRKKGVYFAELFLNIKTA